MTKEEYRQLQHDIALEKHQHFAAPFNAMRGPMGTYNPWRSLAVIDMEPHYLCIQKGWFVAIYSKKTYKLLLNGVSVEDIEYNTEKGFILKVVGPSISRDIFRDEFVLSDVWVGVI